MRDDAPNLRIEVARNAAQAEAHMEGWRQLEEHVLNDNFYYSPEFVLPTLRWLLPDEDVRVVFVYEEGASERLVACVPFRVLPRTDGLPLPTLANLLSPHGYVGTPLVHRDYAAGAVSALMDWADAPERPWHLVAWRRIPLQAATWQLIEEEMRSRGRPPLLRHQFERPVMTPDGSFDDHLARLSARRRQNYRRCSNRLGELAPVQVRVHRDLSLSPDLAREFMELEGQGWKMTNGNALIRTEPDRAFFTELVERAGATSRLFFVEMRQNERAVAMHARFRAGSTLFCFKLGYEQELAKYSPGILSEIECTRAFLDSGLSRVESGTSGESWLSSYWSDTEAVGDLVVATPGMLSRATLSLFPLARGLKRAASRQTAWALDRLRRSKTAA